MENETKPQNQTIETTAQSNFVTVDKREIDDVKEDARVAWDYNTNLEKLNDRLLTQNQQFANALWAVIEQKVFEEIKTMVDDIVDAKLRDYDVTDNPYFVDGVQAEMNDWCFEDDINEALDTNLGYKVAQIINDGQLSFSQ